MEMRIETWEIGRVRPYPGNPRRNAGAVDAVAASIREYGWRQPIVVDADGVVICGHTRLLAAQSLGLAEVPVHVAADLLPAQVRAYRLADNKTGEIAEWDDEALAKELELILATDSPTIPGFTGEDIARLLDLVEHDGSAKEDAEPFGLCEVPESVADNIAKLNAMRRKGNESVISKNDTERYLILVYPNRIEKERVLRALGLPEDERYVAGDSVKITQAGRARVPRDAPKAAESNKAGQHG
jgi:site-specific DNA-methyltransferase (adenine-specific)